jgi:hypothetical protein
MHECALAIAETRRSLDIGRIAALSAWRPSQGIYEIDPTVLEAVMATPATGTIPVEILLKLPAWCVYVPLEGRCVAGVDEGEDLPLTGFFAHLDYDEKENRTELRLILEPSVCSEPNETEVGYDWLLPHVLHLLPGQSFDNCYASVVTVMRKNVISQGLDVDAFDESTENVGARVEQRIMPLVSVLLYLCSQTAEYRVAGEDEYQKPVNPSPKRTKDGWRLFPPDRPKVWHVGERMGAAIRAVTRDHEHMAQVDAETGRKSPRPHVRSAHWATYWTGPKSQQQVAVLKWIPPLAIALAKDDKALDERD